MSDVTHRRIVADLESEVDALRRLVDPRRLATYERGRKWYAIFERLVADGMTSRAAIAEVRKKSGVGKTAFYRAMRTVPEFAERKHYALCRALRSKYRFGSDPPDAERTDDE